MTELKKNQELQEYVRLLENKIHRPEKDISSVKQVFVLSILFILHCLANVFMLPELLDLVMLQP